MIPAAIAAVATPLLKGLFENGLSMLGNAIKEKGKAVVEDKLGIKLPADDAHLTPEQLETMRRIEFEHEETLLELAIRREELKLEGEKVAQEAVTSRWEADMLSDSWLSKNIRPLALVHMLLALDLLMLCALFDVTIPDGYLALVKEMLMLMVGAYFAGRSVEKVVDVYQGWKHTQGN